MGFRGLRAAGADALAGVVVHIRPNVVVGGFIVFRCTAVVQALVIMIGFVIAPVRVPVVGFGIRAAVFLTAYFADGATSTGISAVMVFPDIASRCRMYATRLGA